MLATNPLNSKLYSFRVIGNTIKLLSKNTKELFLSSRKKYTLYISSYYNIASKYRILKV